MKNGLLIYSSYNNIFNIGDYIQSLAAKQYFDEIDIYLNRESLNKYSGEKTKLIINGWFMHEPQNWPPSTDIYPFFVSFHINSVAYKVFLNKESIEYLKKWQPIGCRDKKTVELLEQHGIKAFFSGCLTLTLGINYSSNEKRTGVYFVDPYFEVRRDFISKAKYVYHLLLNYNKIRTISKKIYQNLSFKSIIKSTAFYSYYKKVFDASIIDNMIFIKHYVKESDFDSEIGKFEYAEELLRCYAKAELVVTSRIHCALPCLGLNTPVIYIENIKQDETNACRLDGIKDLFNTVTYNKGKMSIAFNKNLKKIYLKDNIINKKDFLKYKELLIAQCQAFLKQAI